MSAPVTKEATVPVVAYICRERQIAFNIDTDEGKDFARDWFAAFAKAGDMQTVVAIVETILWGKDRPPRPDDFVQTLQQTGNPSRALHDSSPSPTGHAAIQQMREALPWLRKTPSSLGL
jgi:hypothetical protein